MHISSFNLKSLRKLHLNNLLCLFYWPFINICCSQENNICQASTSHSISCGNPVCLKNINFLCWEQKLYKMLLQTLQREENFLHSLKSRVSISKTQRQKTINTQRKSIQRGCSISTIKEQKKTIPH